MKGFINHVVFLIVLLMAITANSQNLLDGPDHAAYDITRDRYLITSSASFAIVAIDNEGVQSPFLSDLGGYIFGIHISGDTLFVGDEFGRVRAYDVNSKSLLWTIFLSGANYIMGMVTDNAGFLYALDNKGYDSKVFKINGVDQSYVTFVSSGIPAFPTEIAYDEPNNRLLLVAYEENSPIMSIDLDDGSLAPVVTPPTFHRAGIIMDNDRNVYFASWYEGLVYKYDQTFTNPPILVSSGHGTITGCGFAYNPVDNILAVPVYSDNRVDFISLTDSDNDAIIDLIDNCPIVANFDQLDTDEDGVGDVCDGCPDDYNPAQEDVDNDGVQDVCDNCPESSNSGQEDSNGNGIGDACDFKCGDANGDTKINLLDVSFIIGSLYRGGPKPDPIESADVNGDGKMNLLDVSYIISYLYRGGPAPNCP